MAWKRSHRPENVRRSSHLHAGGQCRFRVRSAQSADLALSKIDARGEVLKPGTTVETLATSSFYGYGEDVLAVADGEIAYVQDGIPENVPLVSGEVRPPVPLTAATFPGNMVTLKFGNAFFAYYAHLQPGSIRFKVGHRVRRGDVLGRLGNSGNSVGPHLHFHVGKTSSINGGDGFPQLFDRFQLHGHLGAKWSAASSTPATRQMPMLGAVVTFQR
jgi:Peptidase family M23